MNHEIASPNLILPKRYEVLERIVEENGSDISQIVKRIDDSAEHIENLLGQIKVGGVGRFQIFIGKSGAGKTTFLRTLPQFFENVSVHPIEVNVPLNEVATFITNHAQEKGNRIYVLHDRDNPTNEDTELSSFFESLRVLFRKKAGEALVIWPITDESMAQKISDIAWKIGRDSIVPPSGAMHNFTGLDKKDFFDVADVTTRNLNNGESLEAFGITQSNSDELMQKAETIGEYYALVEIKASEINKKNWNILRDKVRPKIWVILAGDDTMSLERTVSSLTQGTKNKIDIDRLCEYLDDTSNKSAYLTEWRNRRSNMAYLMRLFDVRLFELPPSASLSAIRVFGNPHLKNKLKKRSENKDKALASIRRTKVFQAISGNQNVGAFGIATKDEMAYEYRRVQQSASNSDKLLNKALAEALEYVIDEDNINAAVIVEKQNLPGLTLQPDIQIKSDERDIICLELTWRSTGEEVPAAEEIMPAEIAKKQNTLTIGHIQKYVLEKVYEYVKELGF